MQNQRGFIGVGVLIAILVGLAVLGGGAYFVVHWQSTQTASDNFDNVQQLPTTNNQTQQNQPTRPTQTTPAPTTSSLVIHGIYSLRAAPNLTYLGFSLYAEGPNSPLDGVTSLYFNDESSFPGKLTAPVGASFAAIAGNMRPIPSCDLEIEATVEIKNPAFKDRSGEGAGEYKVVFGDFIRVVKRGQATDVCSVDNGHGGTTLERTPHAPDTTSVIKTYTNSQYGFSVTYPSGVTYTLSNPGKFSHGSVSFSLGSAQSGSGRLDMGFPLSPDYCNVPKTDQSHTAPNDLRTETIGGINFFVYTNTSAPPTESYREIIYQGLRDSDCYFFTEDIMGGSVLNSSQITAKLDAIVQSFRFN